jgi:pimeloyl-ACP methyl ester carboxylesterase
MSEKLHFTLVHGTFAQNAKWTNTSSRLQRTLNVRFPQSTTDVFAWSGQNSISARYRASLELREHLRTAHETNPQARNVLIAHSHGGSIALQAANSPPISEMVSGIVCLSTPFISPRDRASDATYLAGGPFGAWGFVALLATCTIWLLLGASRLSPLWRLWSAAFAAGFVTSPVFWVFHSRWYATRIDGLKSKMQLPDTLPCGVLILRAFADEATGVLVSAQFATWLAEQIWRALLWPYKRYIAFTKQERGLFGTVAVSLSSGAIVSFILWNWHNWELGRPVHIPLWLSCIILLPLVSWQIIESANVIFGLASLFSFPLLATIGIVLAPLVGYEMLWASFRLDIAVEATPPGCWSVTTFPVGEHAVSSLMHSSLYDDDRAIEAVCEWVQSNLPTP